MITKHTTHWHFYFNEHCADTAEAVLATVERMFKELEDVPNGTFGYMRVKPHIVRQKSFDGITGQAAVFCRISFEAPKPVDPNDEVKILGFSKQ